MEPTDPASVEQRIKVLDVLTQRVPDVGWRLLLALLPSIPGVSMPTHRPAWRDWSLKRSCGATNAEYWQQVEACADRLCRLVGTAPDRWVQVIEELDDFPAQARDRLIRHITTMDLQPFDSEARRMLADALREKVRGLRNQPYRDRAAPPEVIAELEAARQRLEPQDLTARHLWLFGAYPRLPDKASEDSWQDHDNKVFELRRKALKDVLAAGGSEKVLELAQAAETAASVGFTLGKANLLDRDSQVIPKLLASDNAKVAEFAVGYAHGRFSEEDWSWIDQLALDTWTAEEAGCLLGEVPDFDRRTWEMVSRLGNDVSKQYWSRVRRFCRDGNKEDVEYAVSMLLQHGRPYQAVNVLAMAFHEKLDIDPALLMETLESALVSHAVRPSQRIGYEIGEIFKRLQSDATVEVPRLARLEWAFLGILDGRGASPKTLYRALRTDPRFFADMLTLVLPTDEELEGSHNPLPDEERARARTRFGCSESGRPFQRSATMAPSMKRNF